MTDPSAASSPTDANPYRLPRNVVPSHYNLTLQPDLDEATFSGTCEVSIEVTAATRTIVLNAVELDITEAFLSDAHGRDHVTTAKIGFDANNKIVGFKVDTIANLGAYMSLFSSAVPTYLYATLLSGQYNITNIHCTDDLS